MTGHTPRNFSFRIASLAAVLMLGSALSLGLLLMSVGRGLGFFQPSEAPSGMPDFVKPTNEETSGAVLYFTLDTAFVISFMLVFLGLYIVTRQRSPEFAAFGLACGIFTGLVDAIENAHYLSYALQAQAGVPLRAPALPLLYVLTNMKLVGFFATYLVFGLLFPLRWWLDRAAAALMLLAPTVGIATLALPHWSGVRPLLFSSPAALLIICFWRRSSGAEPRPTADEAAGRAPDTGAPLGAHHP